MSRQKLILNEKIIKNTFDENIKLKREIPEDDRCSDESPVLSGDLFECEDGQLIKIHYQFRNFTPSELASITEYAEDLYEKFKKHVTIYIICRKDVNVCVKECPIFSRASFTIKLIMDDTDPALLTYEEIMKKYENGIHLDDDDLFQLSKLPLSCKKENRHFLREEYFRVMNEML